MTERADRARRVARAPRRGGRGAQGERVTPVAAELGRVFGRLPGDGALSMSAPGEESSWTTEGCAPGTRRNLRTGQVWPIPEGA